MKNRNLDWRDPVVTHRQAIRDLDAYSWAPRAANWVANVMSGFAIALLVVGIWAYATRPTNPAAVEHPAPGATHATDASAQQ